MRTKWKRFFAMFLIMCMLLAQEQMTVFGVEHTESATDVKNATITSGTLGDNDGFTWTYEASTKTLTMTGCDSGLEKEVYEKPLYVGSTTMLKDSPFIKIASDMKKIIFKNCIFKGSLDYLLDGMREIESIEFVNCDTSKVTSMSNMFCGCNSLVELDIGDINTSNVTKMREMFSGCNSLNSLDLSNFDTKNVTDMFSMFSACSGLSSLDLSNFNTKNVTDMFSMFSACNSLSSLDLSSFDTENVTNMSHMFERCNSLISIDLKHFDTKNVTSMSGMFTDCEKLKDLELSGFNTSNVESMWRMFANCKSLTDLDLSSFDTKNVMNMVEMFEDCGVVELDLRSFNTSNVKYMDSMFFCCESITSLDLSGFDTKNVESMWCMFAGCDSLTNIDVSNFDTGNVGNMMDMFAGCSSLQVLDISSFDTRLAGAGGLTEGMLWIKNLEKLHTPKYIGQGMQIELLNTMYDSKGNATNVIDSKHCNMVLTRTVDYTITYELNGGKNNSKNPTTYKKTSDTITLKDATKKGYDFAGWYSDANFKTKVIKIEKGSTGNITLYAKWLPHKYNIKFNGNGADSGSVKTMSNRKYGTSYKLNANKFRKKGYTFTGWTIKKDGSGKKYKDKASIENLTSTDGKIITLYAQWKKTKYTITYVLGENGKNNSKNPTSYYITSSTKELKNPKREGYIFKGWYSDSKYKNKVTKIKKGSTGNKTFYAKWQAHKYNIVFNGNGATSGKMSKLKDRTYGKTYKLLVNQFKKKGFTFIGWNTKADGTGKSYKDKESVKNLTSINGKTVTLFAQWERTKYKISYELYGGTNHSKNPDYYTSVSSKITLKSPKREGYQFVAWHTSDKFTKKNIVKTIEKGSLGNKQFYAEWKANTYNIVFDGNGADSGSMKKISNCKYDKSYTLPANVFSKTDYEFVGWNTKPEGNGYFCNDLASVKNLTAVNNGTVTLYAQWQETKQRAMWFMDELYITQVPGGDYSHAGTYNFDVVGYNGNRNIYAPFDCVIKKIHTGELYGNTVIIESVEKVLYADGTYDYMSMAFAHDNQISDLYVGKEIKQGEVFYQTGDYGYVTGVHCHVTCISGKYQYDMWTKTAYGTYSSPNGIHPTKALFISDKTNVIDNKGLQFEIAP